MSAIENRKIVTEIMAELARGNSRPFGEAMADDCIWRPMATRGPWSTVFHSRQDAGAKLFGPLREQYVAPMKNAATHIFADGDVVVVEAVGDATTTSGKAYNNNYCFVITMKDGKMREVREYCDFALSEAVLQPIEA